MDWVQGMRAASSGGRHVLDWREVFYRRLTGDLLTIPAGEKTHNAEEALGLGQNVYYYVGRTVPDFGAHVVAHDPSRVLGNVEIRTTPFDTGGLYADYIPLHSPLDLSEKKRMVATHTFRNLEYGDPMSKWIDSAFVEIRQYIDGIKPSKSSVEVIDITRSEPPAWTWEGRLPAGEYDSPPLRPIRIYMREHEYLIYTQWLPYQNFIDEDEVIEHLDMLDAITEVVQYPTGAMTEFLCERGCNVEHN